MGWLNEDQCLDRQELAASGDCQLALRVWTMKLAELQIGWDGLDDLVFDRVPQMIEESRGMRHVEQPPFSMLVRCRCGNPGRRDRYEKARTKAL